MRGSQTGDGSPRLRKRDSVTGMRMHNRTDPVKRLQQAPVSRRIRRRTQRSFYDLPFQVDNHDIIPAEDAVIDAARFNRKNTAAMVGDTDIAERQVAQLVLR